jgi:hypothetical protein
LFILEILLLVESPGDVERHLGAEVVLTGVPLFVVEGVVVRGEQGEVTCSRVARYFLAQHSQAGKLYQIAIKVTKLQQNTYATK